MMDISHAKLTEAMEGGKDANWDVVFALRAALDKAEARKVKALVWDGKDGYFRAHDLIGGVYQILESHNQFYLSRSGTGGGGKMVPHPTLESAISAANSEHTARINSALEAGQ